jgi:phosphonopyruvate decarboxylase
MRRDNAIKIIYQTLDDSTLFIFSNGRTSREAYVLGDRKSNFYMLSAMGKSLPVGIGVALATTNKNVVVVEGDGNAFMNLDAFAMAGYCAPKNLTHVVLDNAMHATTGGQKSLSTKINLDAVAESCGYRSVRSAVTEKELRNAISACATDAGPHFILARIGRDSYDIARTPHHTPDVLRSRFMNSIQE